MTSRYPHSLTHGRSLSNIGLHVAGRDSAAFGEFRINELSINELSPVSCRAVLIDPPFGSSAAVVKIGRLQGHASRTTSPLIDIRGEFYGELHICGGEYFYDGMIRVQDGSGNFFPKIYIHNAAFIPGHEPGATFNGDSRGKIQVDIRICFEKDNDGDAVNAGKIFGDLRQVFTL